MARRIRLPEFYGWRVAGAGMISNFLISGVSVWGFGVFIKPMREEMGWTTAQIALGFSIRSFEQGLMAPLTGVLVDRFGPRRMAIAGVFFLVAGLALFATVHTITMYYTASVLIAIGQSVGSFTAYSAALMRWFRRQRGRALGIMNAGNGAGYFVVPALVALIRVVGWRETLTIGAIVVLAVTLPLALVVRNDPSERGQLPDGDGAASDDVNVPAPSMLGMTVREAVRTPVFYLLALAQAANGAVVVGWVVHQIPHLEAQGFSLGAAATVGVVYAASQVLFRPASGLLGDRFGRRRMFVAAFFFQAVGIVVFAMVSPERIYLLPLYYLTFAFGQASWVVLQQATVADYFGPRRFATINGLVQAVQMPVGVASPVIAGAVFDQTGTYVPVFLAYGACSAIAGLSVLLIRRRPLSLAPGQVPAAAAH